MTNPALDLEQYLAAAHAVTAEQLAAARRHAEREDLTLDQALVALRYMDHTELGWCLSELMKLPYRHLISQRPPESVCSAISPRAAAAFGAFPVSYDMRHGILTLAVCEPGAVSRMERLRRLLLQNYELAFTVASKAEIAQAFEFHYGIVLSAATRRQPIPGLLAPPKTVAVPAAEPAAEAPPGDAIPFADMCAAVNAMAALAASLHLKENRQDIQMLRKRVRHSRLLAARLNLQPDRAEYLTLAAWLSALEDREDLISSLPPTLDISAILFPSAALADGQSAEARVLSLLREYEDLARRDAAAARDIGLTRRRLRGGWAASPDDERMIEIFLQILIDEEFLAELEQKSASILMVSADPSSAQSLVAPLMKEGYDVVSVPSISAAMAALAQGPVDLVMAELGAAKDDMLGFCRRVKHSARTAHVAFVIVTGPDGQKSGAESLRAGADDFLIRPVNPEMLAVKVQRLLLSAKREGDRTGVSGSLRDMSFADMIQILTAGGKSMEITVTQEQERGRVFLKDGEVIHAALGEQAGEEAFYRMMQWKLGEFSTRQCVDFPERTISVPVMGLLMEGARLGDESAEQALGHSQIDLLG